MSFILIKSFLTAEDAMSFIARHSLVQADIVATKSDAFGTSISYIADEVGYHSCSTRYGIPAIAHTADSASLALPATVVIDTEEGLQLDATVTWDKAGSDYDAGNPLEQRVLFTGTVTLPSGVTNASNRSLEHDYFVTVKAENLVSVSFIGDSTIEGLHNGTSMDELTSYWIASLANIVTTGTIVSTSVVVDTSVPIEYDPTLLTAQTFTIKVNAVLPVGVTNTNNVSLSRTYTITVDAQESLVSITALSAITDLVNGTPKTEAGLSLNDIPATIVTDGNTTETEEDIVWDVAGCSYDPLVTTEQTFDVTGLVTLPEWVINPEEVSLSVTVSVTVLAVA